jgi:hypothetical protein
MTLVAAYTRAGRARARLAERGRARDLQRLDDLTGPHLPYPGAPIQGALLQMNPDDRAEAIAIIGPLGDHDIGPQQR